jgi:hypothetical protein
MNPTPMMSTSAPSVVEQCYNNVGNRLTVFTMPAEKKNDCIRMIRDSSENNKNETDDMKLCLDSINPDSGILEECFIPKINEPFRQTENSDKGKMSCGKMLCVLLVIFLLYMLFKGNTKNKIGMKQHLQYFFF